MPTKQHQHPIKKRKVEAEAAVAHQQPAVPTVVTAVLSSSSSSDGANHHSCDVIAPAPDFELMPKIVMDDLLGPNATKDSAKDALKKIYQLCSDAKEGAFNRRELYEAGGHAAIITSMTKWNECQFVQNLACMILTDICQENTTFCISAVKVGALQAVLSAMKKFPASEGLQEQGCQALEVMCFHSQTHRDRLVARSNHNKGIINNNNNNTAAATETIVAAMSSFPNCMSLQLSACRLLFALSYETSTRKLVEQAGGAIALAATMQRTRDLDDDHDQQSKEIYSFACTALSNLCAGAIHEAE